MYIDAYDYLLLPVYLFLFFKIITWVRKKYYADSPLGKYLIIGFLAKMFGCILYALFIQYYYGGGDSFMFFKGGVDLKNIIVKDFSQNLHFLFSPAEEFGKYYETYSGSLENAGYLSGSSNLMAAKFVAFFSLFTFDKYLLISICFGLFSFSGFWQCFKIFSERFPLIQKKFALAFLYLPSLLFWGSGIAKDPLCIGFLGWLFFGCFRFFINNDHRIKYLLIIVISAYFLFALKSYIFFAFSPLFIFWITLEYIKKIQNPALRRAVLPSLLLLASILYYINSTQISEVLGDYAIEDFTQNVENNQKIYEQITDDNKVLIQLGTIEPTMTGILKKLPVTITTTLFRPFIWESTKLITFFSALESLFVLLFTLYVLFKTRVYRFFIIILGNNMLLFSFLFSVFFAGAIGLMCFNFGTLVRYKIPCLPFYIASLFIIEFLNISPARNLFKVIQPKKENLQSQ